MSDRFPNLGPLPAGQGHVPMPPAAASPAAATAQSGMVRIHRAHEVRYVWPVHVPGWLSSGWQLGDDRHGRDADGLDVPVVNRGPVALTVTDPTRGPSSLPATPIRQDSAPEGEPEPIDAYLPTNLLDLDAGPITAPSPTAGNDAGSAWIDEQLQAARPEIATDAAPAAVPSSSAGNDAGSASTGEPVPTAAAAPAELAERGAEAAQPDLLPADNPAAEPPIDSNEEANAAPAADLLAEPSTEPTPSPAPARRGRPRKLRPELESPSLESPSPVLAAEPADQHATGPAGVAASEPQESAPQPPAASSLLVNAASLLDGDDPYGIDPLL